jgi:hypothetical protein
MADEERTCDRCGETEGVSDCYVLGYEGDLCPMCADLDLHDG